MFWLKGLSTSGMMKTRLPLSLLTSTGGPGAVQAGIAWSAVTFEATIASRAGNSLPDELAVVLLPHAAVKTSSAATTAPRLTDVLTNARRRIRTSSDIADGTPASADRPEGGPWYLGGASAVRAATPSIWLMRRTVGALVKDRLT